MRTALRILVALAIAVSLIWAALSLANPQALPVWLAVIGGAALSHAIDVGWTAFFESASPATKAQRRLVRDVEQAVERRKLQQEQAHAAESRGNTAGGAA